MPITIEIVYKNISKKIFDKVFAYFKYIDNKFSIYKKNSEITRINNGAFKKDKYSSDMKEVFKLSEKTKKETNGYFNILRGDKFDPSGLVKGWAIYNAAKILLKEGMKNFYVDAGGDIQAYGKNRQEQKWRVGIRNPFKIEEIIKTVAIENKGIATSGISIRGQHIYNPFSPQKSITEIVSLTVIGPNIYEADRFATAAFSMGNKGINFIDNLKGFEGYMIDKNGIATLTNGFEGYIIK